MRDEDIRVVRCYAHGDTPEREVVCNIHDLAFVIAAALVTPYRRVAIYLKADADVEAIAQQLQETPADAS